jgi:hypothetical protein
VGVIDAVTPKRRNLYMHRMKAFVPLAGLALLGACLDQNPTETRDDGDTFPVIANWSAQMNPVGSNTQRGTLAIKQMLGQHNDVTFTVTGPANASYPWRIFRGNCATTTAAATVRDPGLWVFATVQSYPDIVLNAQGTATVTRSIAGLLDSLTAYSIRIRASQSSTAFNGTSPLACGDLQRGPA